MAQLALTPAKLGEMERAVAFLERMRLVYPASSELLLTLGGLARRLGRRDLARGCFETCASTHDGDEITVDSGEMAERLLRDMAFDDARAAGAQVIPASALAATDPTAGAA